MLTTQQGVVRNQNNRTRGLEMNCKHCNKPIVGRRVIVNPPVLHIELGIDSVREYHPSCYRDSVELEASELDECGDLEQRLSAALKSR